MLENVGGASALLGLIAMATDVEELYAAVKALVCVVKSNKNILKDMDRIQGYQVFMLKFIEEHLYSMSYGGVHSTLKTYCKYFTLLILFIFNMTFMYFRNFP